MMSSLRPRASRLLHRAKTFWFSSLARPVCAGQTVVLDTCDSNFDTTLTHHIDGNAHTIDDSGPCGIKAVIAQTFGSGSHTIDVGMYSSGGNYRLRCKPPS